MAPPVRHGSNNYSPWVWHDEDSKKQRPPGLAGTAKEPGVEEASLLELYMPASVS